MPKEQILLVLGPFVALAIAYAAAFFYGATGSRESYKLAAGAALIACCGWAVYQITFTPS